MAAPRTQGAAPGGEEDGDRNRSGAGVASSEGEYGASEVQVICVFLSDQHAAGRRADPRSLPALGPPGREGATGGAQRYGWVGGG